MNIQSLLTNLPYADIEAAIADPQNLGKEAAIVQDIITIACPGIDGVIINLLVTLFVQWVYRSGGGIITADADPEVDAQTTVNHPRVR